MTHRRTGQEGRYCRRTVVLLALVIGSHQSCGLTHGNFSGPGKRLAQFSASLGTFKDLARGRRAKMFQASQVVKPKPKEHLAMAAMRQAIDLEKGRMHNLLGSLADLSTLDRVKRPLMAQRAFVSTSPSHPKMRLSQLFRTLLLIWSQEQKPPRKQR